MVALIFLGLGWNFLFISGTSLVVLTYKEEEKFRVQGINDLIVFSTMALASLSAGIMLSLTSWKTMNLICIPFLVLIVYSTFRADILSKNKKPQQFSPLRFIKLNFIFVFLVLNLPPLTSFSKKLPTCSPTSVNTTPVAPS